MERRSSYGRWLCCDSNGMEYLSDIEPIRNYRLKIWVNPYSEFVMLPIGFSNLLIGRQLTWEDDCVELIESRKKDE